MLYNEYAEIQAPNESSFVKMKKTKVRTKQILMTQDYWKTASVK
jgi:hypothetical protein